MEIVGEPDLKGPEEARDYLMAMRQILRYIGASTANMEEGAFRCDANISTRSIDGTIVGSKVEIKNMNSFRAVERALRYEEDRQRGILAGGGTIEQETRGWVEAKGVTVSQRSKEQAHDYRYFPEPDLPPLSLTADVVESIARQIARASRCPPRCGCRTSTTSVNRMPLSLRVSDQRLITSSRLPAEATFLGGPVRPQIGFLTISLGCNANVVWPPIACPFRRSALRSARNARRGCYQRARGQRAPRTT